MKHEHRFDPESGWCQRCGLRDDGRLIHKGGAILQPGLTPQELHEQMTKETA